MRTLRLVGPLALLWTALVGCNPQNGPNPAGTPAAGSAPPPPEVTVIAVSARTVELTSELPGRLQSIRSALVRARVEGVVQKINFHEGSEVSTGTSLYQIEPKTYASALEAAKADAMAAEQTWRRNQALLQAKAISQQDFDGSEARYKQTRAALAKAELDHENALVLSPISGRIGHSLVTEGALVGRGESTALADIEQLDPDPFMDMLNAHGLPWQVKQLPAPVEF